MVSSRRVAAFLVGITLYSCLQPVIAAPSDDFPVAAEKFMSGYVQQGKFRGVILVASRGKIIFERGFGKAVEGWDIPNTPSTKFEIASVSKQFTGAAILQLAQKGKLALDDPISKYYPKAPADWKAITIRQIANHNSGLPANMLENFSKGICKPYSLEELLETFARRPLNFSPGTSWKYTNTEYYLLAYIIEKVSGESYADYLDSHIFQPLGMNDSGFSSTLAVLPGAAEGYTHEGAVLRHRDYYDRSLEVGAGGIHSTADDLWKWNQALASDRLLLAKWREEMFKPSVPGNYGFGWFIAESKYPSQFHEGSDPGFAAFDIRYPTKDALVIVLSNLEDAPVREIAQGLGSLLLDGNVLHPPQ